MMSGIRHQVWYRALGLLALGWSFAQPLPAQESAASTEKTMSLPALPHLLFKPAIQINPYGFLDLDVDAPNNFGSFFGITPSFNLISLLNAGQGKPTRLILGSRYNWRFFNPEFLLSQAHEFAAYAI